MSSKKEHIMFLKSKGNFSIDCITEIFTRSELRSLEKYGHWFQALSDETLMPLNMKQEQFVRVAKGELEPETIWENAWRKYLDAKIANSKPGDIADKEYLPYEDTFYSRDMAKKMKGMMYGEMKKNHREI